MERGEDGDDGGERGMRASTAVFMAVAGSGDAQAQAAFANQLALEGDDDDDDDEDAVRRRSTLEQGGFNPLEEGGPLGRKGSTAGLLGFVSKTLQQGDGADFEGGSDDDYDDFGDEDDEDDPCVRYAIKNKAAFSR